MATWKPTEVPGDADCDGRWQAVLDAIVCLDRSGQGDKAAAAYDVVIERGEALGHFQREMFQAFRSGQEKR